MIDSHDPGDTNEEPVRFVDTVFVKSPQARSIHYDGVWGGITPQGLIMAAFFTEYRTYPSRVNYEITPEGGLAEQSRDDPGSITRQIEAEVFMSLESARSFRNWLSEKITQLEDQSSRRPGRTSESAE